MAKDLEQTNHVTEDIEHEEVAQGTDPAPASEVLTIETVVTNEIKKFSLPDTRIAELKAAYGGLVIADPNDAQQYKKVQEARAVLRSLRTGLEKKRVLLNEDHLKITRGINGEAKRLTLKIQEIEQPLDAELKRVDGLKEAARIEKEQKEQAELQGRVSTLLSHGVQFNGSYYVMGETISLDVVTLKTMAPDKFETLLTLVKTKHQEQLDAQAEADRLEAEAKAALEQQKIDQEAEAARLKKEREDMEAERRQLIQDRTDARANQLQTLGFDWKTPDMLGINIGADFSVRISTPDFENLPAQDWTAKLEGIRDLVNRAHQHEKEAQETRQARVLRDQQRKNVLYGLGMNEDKQGFFYLQTDTYGKTLKQAGAFLLGLSDGEWDQLFDDIQKEVAATRRADTAEKEKVWRYQERRNALQSIYHLVYMPGEPAEFARVSAFEGVRPVTIQEAEVVDLEPGAWEERVDTLEGALNFFKNQEHTARVEAERKAEAARVAALGEVEQLEYFLEVMTAALVKAPSLTEATLKRELDFFVKDTADRIHLLSNAGRTVTEAKQ